MTAVVETPLRNRIVGTGEANPADLVANPANWRMHPAAQTKALAGALQTVGWVQQVTVNQRTGHLVDGHARVTLAVERGEPTVPVVYVDLDPDEEALVLATLDPIGAMATTNTAKLKELLASVKVDESNLVMFLSGMGGGRQGRKAEPDDVPEPSADPYVQPGDLWQLGPHRVLCGDATNPADVQRVLGGGPAKDHRDGPAVWRQL